MVLIGGIIDERVERGSSTGFRQSCRIKQGAAKLSALCEALHLDARAWQCIVEAIAARRADGYDAATGVD
jgi:hypothetical protein